MSDPDKNYIPKEQLTAFQRWELASFDTQPSPQPAKKPPRPAKADKPESSPPPPPPRENSEETLRRLKEQAREEGYQQGFEQGHSEGLTQGQEQGQAQGQSEGHEAGYQAGYEQGMQQAATDLERLQHIMTDLQQAINQVDESIAEEILSLALDVAQKMTRQYLQVEPDTIIPIIQQALETLPDFNQDAHLLLHPDDAELVKQRLGDELHQSGWKIINHQQMERGGCQLKTRHSQVDASNAARWQHIVDTIGQDKPWYQSNHTPSAGKIT